MGITISRIILRGLNCPILDIKAPRQMHSFDFCGFLRRIYYNGAHTKDCLARTYFELIWEKSVFEEGGNSAGSGYV